MTAFLPPAYHFLTNLTSVSWSTEPCCGTTLSPHLAFHYETPWRAECLWRDREINTVAHVTIFLFVRHLRSLYSLFWWAVTASLLILY